jgi:hypothetical protein
MLPESWPDKYKCLQDTPTAIASHHHTIAPSYPTLLAHPANRPLHYPIATHQNSTNHSNNTNYSHENKRRVNE